jgi:hypothetical protein
MKTILLGLALSLCAVMLPAEELQYSRTLMNVGASATIGGDRFDASNIGGGLFFKSMTYFDPSRPSGLCYGIFSTYCFHTAGGVELADTRLVTLGYRGLLTPWLGVEVDISPTLGARIERKTIEGSAYLGIGPSLTVFVPVNEGIDISLSYEPVFNLLTLDGSASARNKSYSDIALGVTFKSYSQVRTLHWE